MTSDVGVTSALRSNLTSLNKSQNSTDSAVKNDSRNEASQKQSYHTPDSLVASQSLNERASTLQSTIDNINQSIRTLEIASNTAEKLSSLLSDAEKFTSNVLAEFKNDQAAQRVPEDISTTLSDVLTQIDNLVGDAAYKGKNLLIGDSVSTSFSAGNAAPLITDGANLSTSGLGLNTLPLQSGAELSTFLTNVQDAEIIVNDLRQFINNDLSTIQTRRDFAQETISTLTPSSEGLAITDQSEEGANLLALKTRQDLSGSDLSLAADGQQSIFRLF